ncbi:methyltransferase family protein [Lacisediminihabitans sp.]|jgi:protein-S-isoprenylcysteine O-methyltransferase Ste14|uniref:methyltransferase family protein n=1 Tax=Lacisediminihabitans sp. TaxID=2787631 RepID=UPI002F92A889
MRRALAFGLVFAQFVLLAALVFVPHGTVWPVNGLIVAATVVLGATGVLLAGLGLVGLGPALTASPIPRENAPFVTGGVYGLVRNPIYTGLIAGGAGLVLLGASVWHIVAWVLLVLLLSSKTRWEERMLLAEHPEFAEYARRVGRFLPGIGRLRKR